MEHPTYSSSHLNTGSTLIEFSESLLCRCTMLSAVHTLSYSNLILNPEKGENAVLCDWTGRMVLHIYFPYSIDSLKPKRERISTSEPSIERQTLPPPLESETKEGANTKGRKTPIIVIPSIYSTLYCSLRVLHMLSLHYNPSLDAM